MPEVTLESARTSQADPEAAAEELIRRIAGAEPKLAVLFANRNQNLPGLVGAVRNRLPKGTRLLGATTSSTIDNQGFHDGETILGLLSGDFEVGIGFGRDIRADAVSAGAQAVQAAAAQLGRREADLDTRRYMAVVIDDGHRQKKEEILLGVLEKNPALTLVGGGATDRMPQDKPGAEVFVDGDIADDAVAVALFHTDATWAALRPHAYQPTGERVTFTKVDDATRRVLEINGKPAAEEYANLLGIPVSELDFGKPNGFSSRPTALRVGREYFMRSPWMALPDGSISFVSHVAEGTELELMKLGDMVAMTRKFFAEDLPRRVPSPHAALLFNCGGRSWVSRALGIHDALGGAYDAAPPLVGFDCAGEIYNGFAIDTTLTVLAFGAGNAD